jgi:hypothetical protein
MKNMSVLQWLLLLPALLLFLLSLGLCLLVLSFMPPLVGWAAAGVVVVVVVWFILVRSRGAGPVSEAGLIGRQSSKDGLL